MSGRATDAPGPDGTAGAAAAPKRRRDVIIVGRQDGHEGAEFGRIDLGPDPTPREIAIATLALVMHRMR